MILLKGSRWWQKGMLSLPVLFVLLASTWVTIGQLMSWVDTSLAVVGLISRFGCISS